MSETDGDLVREMRRHVGQRGTPKQAKDAVNPSSIHKWCAALGIDNPRYFVGGRAAAKERVPVVAPPAMLCVWNLPGYSPEPEDINCPRTKVFSLLKKAGFTSVIGTGTEEVYTKPVSIGEVLVSTLSLLEVSDLKTTAMGIGFFITTLTEFVSGDGELVGSWKFTTFNFKSRELTEEEVARKKASEEAASRIPRALRVRPRPGVMRETEFFWEGAKKGELRIQQCGACGLLAHPPVVRCPACGSYEFGYQISNGKAKLHAFVEPVYPQMPFMTYPYVVGLVDLDEGTRLLTNIVHCPPEHVKIGMDLDLVFQQTDFEMILPMFRPSQPSRRLKTLNCDDVDVGSQLPLWPLDVTTKLVVAGALATGDYTDIHHEVAAAKRVGAKDLLMNVLTSVGLCNRYVEDWAGPGAQMKGVSVRLGAPSIVGDTITFSAEVTSKEIIGDTGRLTISVRGSNSIGDHVSGILTVDLPSGVSE